MILEETREGRTFSLPDSASNKLKDYSLPIHAAPHQFTGVRICHMGNPH